MSDLLPAILLHEASRLRAGIIEGDVAEVAIYLDTLHGLTADTPELIEAFALTEGLCWRAANETGRAIVDVALNAVDRLVTLVHLAGPNDDTVAMGFGWDRPSV